MKLVSNFVNSIPVQTTTLVSLIAILAVFGPFISVSGGFWDAVNHLLNEPDYFWSIQHMVVYFGVSLVASAGFLGMLILIKKIRPRNSKNWNFTCSGWCSHSTSCRFCRFPLT